MTTTITIQTIELTAMIIMTDDDDVVIVIGAYISYLLVNNCKCSASSQAVVLLC